MKIIDVSTTTYRIPPTVPWEDATHSVSGIELIVTTLKTNTGLIGTGISYTVGIGGSAVQSLIEDYMVNMIIGRDPLNVEEIWGFLFQQLHRCGAGITSLAIAAIDTALWDIRGKHYKQPLYKLIGGARDRIPAYASGIDFNMSLDELLETVDQYMLQGYQSIKIKIGRNNIEEDVERIVKVKERIGIRRNLMVDVNQGWSSTQAFQNSDILDKIGIFWIEEPISSDDVEGHVHLRKSTKTPIAIGESLYNKFQFLQYLKAGAVDFIQADVSRVGGITEWIKIAHISEAWSKPVAPHFLMELSVHLLCGVPNGYILENVIGGSLSEMGVLEEPIVVNDGFCTPSSEYGHGIRLNLNELKSYKVDSQKLRAMHLESNKIPKG